jgi:antitoxin HicB
MIEHLRRRVKVGYLRRQTMKKIINDAYVGQDFDAFLAEEGLSAEVEARAIKKVVVAMLKKTGLTQVELAERLHTSRTQVRRLLDPDCTSITLSTLQRAADVTGNKLVVSFQRAR